VVKELAGFFNEVEELQERLTDLVMSGTIRELTRDETIEMLGVTATLLEALLLQMRILARLDGNREMANPD